MARNVTFLINTRAFCRGLQIGSFETEVIVIVITILIIDCRAIGRNPTSKNGLVERWVGDGTIFRTISIGDFGIVIWQF